MSYISASVIQEGLIRLRIPLDIAHCDLTQFAALVEHDRQRVTVDGRDGVLISYHLAEPEPDDHHEIIIAFAYPELHQPVPVHIQKMINALVGS
ncbi:MAG: hypothetical protein ACM3ZQ_05300 [Bacillota bacterium]